MATFDIFNNKAFNAVELTDAINVVPNNFGRIGAMGIFTEKSVRTTSVAIEIDNGVLNLLPPTQRGGPASLNKSGKRSLKNFVIPQCTSFSSWFGRLPRRRGGKNVKISPHLYRLNPSISGRVHRYCTEQLRPPSTYLTRHDARRFENQVIILILMAGIIGALANRWRGMDHRLKKYTPKPVTQIILATPYALFAGDGWYLAHLNLGWQHPEIWGAVVGVLVLVVTTLGFITGHGQYFLKRFVEVENQNSRFLLCLDHI